MIKEHPSTRVDEQAVFDRWLQRFGALMGNGDVSQLSEVFNFDSYWKDILAFTWERRTCSGLQEIEAQLQTTRAAVKASDFTRSATRTPPRQVRRSGRSMIEGYFDFKTAIGSGTGFARLLINEAQPYRSNAWIVLTTLQQIDGYEEKVGSRRPTGVEYSMNFAGDNWLDLRKKSQAYADRDPEVLIVGGAQCGLILAARLLQRGVDVLIVEKTPRIGDVWRNRYHSLTLHNEVWANSLPYMPFPETWPTFVPKDKLADWLEYYAEAMEINHWTSTELISATYDTASGRWTAQLRRPDGSIRTMRVPQLVLATGGVSGTPNKIAFPGLETFKGEIVHSSGFSSGLKYRGQKAIVIGAGTSGHDVAQELASNGAAQVTMVQRGPTCIVSLIPSGTLVYSVYGEGPPPEDVDLITASVPYPVMREAYQWLTKKTCDMDRKLLDSLEAVGFELGYGEDETGFHMLYLRRGGGYYLNVGCSELIAAKAIGLVQHRDTDRFQADGLELGNGTKIEADLVVLATGFANLQESIRQLLGDEVANRVGPVWGFDENYSMRNMWKRTAQKGFWIMGGSLIDARLNSTFLALEILAELRGVR